MFFTFLAVDRCRGGWREGCSLIPLNPTRHKSRREIFFPSVNHTGLSWQKRRSLIAERDSVLVRRQDWFVAGFLSGLLRKAGGEIQKVKSRRTSPAIQTCMNLNSSKTFSLTYRVRSWLRLKVGGGGGKRKSKASILQMMKPPYNALQDVKVLCVKFMSAWPPLAEMMGLFTAIPSVCC